MIETFLPEYAAVPLIINFDISVIAASVSASFPAPVPLPVPAPVAEEAERPRKKPRKKQEYVPGVGTANYAFIIVLYQVPPLLRPSHAVRRLQHKGAACSYRMRQRLDRNNMLLRRISMGSFFLGGRSFVTGRRPADLATSPSLVGCQLLPPHVLCHASYDMAGAK